MSTSSADLIYALMAANVYGAKDRANTTGSGVIRHPQNTLPLPVSWSPLGEPRTSVDGFMAQAYQRGNDIVIAYAGTTDETVYDWITGNAPAASAKFLSPQVFNAARYYLDILKNNPASNITFTGHSLGGGLASLMAVYFDRPAVVFDEAPFLKSADSVTVVEQLRKSLQAVGYSLPMALKGYLALDPTGAFVASPARVLRDDQVRHHHVVGEILSLPIATVTNLLAILTSTRSPSTALALWGIDKVNDGIVRAYDTKSQSILGWGFDGITQGDPVALHSITLLTAILQSSEFLSAMQKYPELLPRLFSGMFKNSPKLEEANLIDLLVQRQQRDEGALDALVNDVSKIDRQNGLTSVGNINLGDYRANVSSIVIDAILAGLYEQGMDRRPDMSFVSAFKPVLKAVTGGLTFDLSEFSSSVRTLNVALDEMVSFMLKDDKGKVTYSSDARWTLQTGQSALQASQTGDAKTDMMLGYDQGDNLNGGAGDDVLMGLGGADTLLGGEGLDVLVGGEGNDELNGGAWGDYLYGGAGKDTYVFNGDYGFDYIEDDKDGQGEIKIDGQTITGSGAVKVSKNTYVDKTTGWQFYIGTFGTDETAALIINKVDDRDKKITIRNWKNTQMGITLDESSVPASPIGMTKLLGDQTAPVSEPMKRLADGNYSNGIAAPDFADVLNTSLNNLGLTRVESQRFDMEGLGGNDALGGYRNDDRIDGGAGNDLLVGAGGQDTLIGGTGNDVILAWQTMNLGSIYSTYSNPDPFLWAPPADATVLARAPRWGIYKDAVGQWQFSDYSIYWRFPNTDLKGDLIDGGTGNDTIVGSYFEDTIDAGADNDVLTGWGGSDRISGGAGDDEINGDTYYHLLVNGGITLSFRAEDDYVPKHGNDFIDGGAGYDTIVGEGGSDVIFGGSGADELWGDAQDPGGIYKMETALSEHGNDYIDGGSENDYIEGGGRDDYLLGGDGNDSIFGDSDNQGIPVSVHGQDTLEGGKGNDQLTGGGDADLLRGGDDDDKLWGDDEQSEVPLSAHGRDTLDGGDGKDLLIGGGDSDLLIGGLGNDTLEGDGSTATVDATGHGDDHLDGGEGNDQIRGGGKDDTLIGGEGDDVLWGDDSGQSVAPAAHGRDYLAGGNGYDKLYGGGDADELHGGAGFDVIYGDAIESEVDASAHGNDSLHGNDGNDTLIGGGKDDVLFGGSDNDSLWGDDVTANLGLAAHGADELYGGDGNDQLTGGGKDDQLYGGVGSDVLSGDDHVSNVAGSAHGADYLDGGSDNDYLYGDGGNDTLMGGSGNDYLAGEHQLSSAIADQTSSLLGDDLLMGEDGNDVLMGGEGNDELDGGADNDTLIGGAGADTYLFGIGSGQDTVYNEDSDAVGTNEDTILLGTGITPEGVTLTRSNDDLIISLNDSEDRLYVQDYFQADGTSTSGVENIKFTDGPTWDIAFVKSEVLTPRSGNDSLYGYDTPDAIIGLGGADELRGNAGNDTLEGGADNDSLYGGAGSDTYQFSRGDGQDTIGSSADTSVGDIDTLWMKSGITPEDMILNTAGTSLIVKIRGSTDQITIEDFLYQNNPNNSKSPLQQIKFTDGPTWNLSAILSKLYGGSALADRLDGTSSGETINGQGGNDTLNGNEGDDTLNGGADSDTLDGGIGSDSLRGGTGADTYKFGEGSGQDRINNEDADALGVNQDSIQLGSGLTPNDVTLTRSGDDLIIRLNGSDDQLTVQSYFQADGASSFTVENLRFDGDAVWNYATVKANVGLLINGSNDGEPLTGGQGNDALFGQGGNDTLDGGAKNDVLDGGLGNDSLRGGAGDDTYRFGKGDGQDVIAGNTEATPQNDTLSFKVGVALSDVRLSKSGTSLLVKIANSTDQVTIEDFFYQDTPTNVRNAVKQLEFANGIKWSLANITTQIAATILQGNANGNPLTAPNGNHIIYGGQGSDTLRASQGDDSLYGEEGTEFINAGGGNDYLDGGPDRDWLRGEEGDDTLDGGTGNDNLNGGSGNNTYLFGRGDGMDGIEPSYSSENGTVSTLLFKPGIAPSEVVLKSNGNFLYIDLVGTTTDNFTVSNFFYNGDPYSTQNPIQQIKFANGTTWDIATILSKLPPSTAGADAIYGSYQADSLKGLDGADSLFGNGGNDTLEGGTGNDTIKGGEGSDTYVYGKGDGQDVIKSTTDATAGKADTLLFKAGTSAADIGLSTSGTSLIIKIAGSTDQITVEDFLYQSSPTHTNNPLQQIQFTDGSNWSLTDISTLLAATLVQGNTNTSPLNGSSGNDKLLGMNGNDTLVALAGSDFLFAGEGDDSLEGGEGDDWLYGEAGGDKLQGGSNNDHLIGGIGNDYLYGGLGNDTYLFKKGDGTDVIYDRDTVVGNSDVISFADVKSSELISISRTSRNSLVVQYGASDSVEVTGFFLPTSSAAYQTEKITFSDGVTWSLPDIIQKSVYSGTLGNDNMTSYTNGVNQIDGGDGDDTLTGAGYADTLSGGLGRDSLIGGAGSDWLRGGTGTDILEGGVGNDVLYGDAGADTYVYIKGDGYDVIYGQRTEDTLVMKGFASTDVTFSRRFSDIDIGYPSSGTTYSIVTLVRQAFDGAHEFTGVNQIVFDDKTISADEIRKLALIGTSGNDSNLRGYVSNDSIEGRQGNDSLYGESGSDTLNGGTGADRLEGGTSNDTYVFAAGDGTDVIYDNDATAGNTDVISFTNVKSTDIVSVVRNASNGLVLNHGAADSITIDNYFTSSSYRVEHFKFSDGVTWTAAAVDAIMANGLIKLPAEGSTWEGKNTADVVFGSSGIDSVSGLAGSDWLHGNSGNDILRGGEGADLLVGGLGSDALYGDAGTDTYVYNKGDGYDVIYGQRAEDTLIMKGFKSTDVTFNRQFSDINIAQTSSGTSYNIVALVRQAFDSPHEFTGVSQIVFDDKTITADEVRKLALQGSSGNDTNLRGYVTDDIINGLDGNDSLFGEDGNDKLYGGGGEDMLDGGTGNDYLGGGTGNDTYRFSRGGGQDNIVDIDATVGNTDILQFQSGIAHDQLWFSQSGSNLTISVIGTTDSVMIAGGAGSASLRIEQLTAGGKTLSHTQVANLVQAMASMTPPAMGQTTLTDAQRAQLAPVLAANWS